MPKGDDTYRLLYLVRRLHSWVSPTDLARECEADYSTVMRLLLAVDDQFPLVKRRDGKRMLYRLRSEYEREAMS